MRNTAALSHERLAHLVKEVARTFDRALQMRLATHEVSIGHWPFLRALWAADGLTQRELSDEAGVMQPTTFAALKAMERRGYIVRRPVAGDRRKRQVFLTARGRSLESKLVPLAKDINAIAARGMPTADIAATRRTLLALYANLAAQETHGGEGLRVPSTRERGRLVLRVASPPRQRR
jgi:DNA-binding MarR family transcriptional regulator